MTFRFIQIHSDTPIFIGRASHRLSPPLTYSHHPHTYRPPTLVSPPTLPFAFINFAWLVQHAHSLSPRIHDTLTTCSPDSSSAHSSLTHRSLIAHPSLTHHSAIAHRSLVDRSSLARRSLTCSHLLSLAAHHSDFKCFIPSKRHRTPPSHSIFHHRRRQPLIAAIGPTGDL